MSNSDGAVDLNMLVVALVVGVIMLLILLSIASMIGQQMEALNITSIYSLTNSTILDPADPVFTAFSVIPMIVVAVIVIAIFFFAFGTSTPGSSHHAPSSTPALPLDSTVDSAPDPEAWRVWRPDQTIDERREPWPMTPITRVPSPPVGPARESEPKVEPEAEPEHRKRKYDLEK